MYFRGTCGQFAVFSPLFHIFDLDLVRQGEHYSSAKAELHP